MIGSAQVRQHNMAWAMRSSMDLNKTYMYKQLNNSVLSMTKLNPILINTSSPGKIKLYRSLVLLVYGCESQTPTA